MPKIKLLLFAYLTIILPAHAQTSFPPTDDRMIGINGGIGFQNIGQMLSPQSDIWGINTPYYYKLYFFELRYEQKIGRIRQKDLFLSFPPQYNKTEFKEEDHDEMTKQGFESGMILGLKLRKKLLTPSPSHLFYELSVGPHFISASPSRQSSGFIFSDNLAVGIDFQSSPNLFSSISLGFRHISNARFHNPNEGINTICLKVSTHIYLRKI